MHGSDVAFVVWQLRWELLNQWYKQGAMLQGAPFQFAFLGMDMCRTAAARILGSSGPRMTRWVAWIREGHTQPPQDLRSHQVHVESAEMLAADVLLAWVRN